jgi:hypothetical protein
MLKENGIVVKIWKQTSDCDIFGSFDALTRDKNKIDANFFGVSLLRD